MENEERPKNFLDQIQDIDDGGNIVSFWVVPPPEDDPRRYVIKDKHGRDVSPSKVSLNKRVESEIRMFGRLTTETEREFKEREKGKQVRKK